MKNLIAGLAMLAALTGHALAHGEGHGPNGGPMTDAGEYHVELVRSETSVTFFVTTHEAGTPVETADATGFAIVQSGGKTERLTVTPEAPNKLIATASAAPAMDAKIAVTFTIAGAQAVSARFDLNEGHDGHAH